MPKGLRTSALLLAIATALGGCGRTSQEQAESPPPPGTDVTNPRSGHLTGTVTGASGPEAGVWVIAETDDFDTRFARIVVTDEAGRFLVPDLPAADSRVWVRGYGLADSDPVAALPGDTVGLTVHDAATAAAWARKSLRETSMADPVRQTPPATMISGRLLRNYLAQFEP